MSVEAPGLAFRGSGVAGTGFLRSLVSTFGAGRCIALHCKGLGVNALWSACTVGRVKRGAGLGWLHLSTSGRVAVVSLLGQYMRKSDGLRVGGSIGVKTKGRGSRASACSCRVWAVAGCSCVAGRSGGLHAAMRRSGLGFRGVFVGFRLGRWGVWCFKVSKFDHVGKYCHCLGFRLNGLLYYHYARGVFHWFGFPFLPFHLWGSGVGLFFLSVLLPSCGGTNNMSGARGWVPRASLGYCLAGVFR